MIAHRVKSGFFCSQLNNLVLAESILSESTPLHHARHVALFSLSLFLQRELYARSPTAIVLVANQETGIHRMDERCRPYQFGALPSTKSGCVAAMVST